MASCCPVCDRPMPRKAERRGLMVQSEPWRVFWQERAGPRATPMECRFLFQLLSFGRVRTTALEALLNEDSSGLSVRIHIGRLREKLRIAGIPAKIRSIHGWGYEIDFEEENR